MALINAADGSVAAAYRYDAFGTPLAYVGDMAQENPYLFTAREYDWQTGVYYYRARSYDAHLGRFLQQDPAGMVDGPNMYVYCGNDPVGRRDPTGMRYLRITYRHIGFRPFSSALYDHVVACMIGGNIGLSIGTITMIAATCILGATPPITIFGVIGCALLSTSSGAAALFIDCVIDSWGPAQKDCGFRWYSFFWFLTDTGYSGYIPT